jgi:Tol biopolymer transport system component
MLTDAMDEHPPSALVRAELDRILASEIFSRSDRLSAFLKFIVERTLDGQGDGLKEQVIALELYGKGSDFNTAADPIVRVDARRLRDRLREYYASAPPASVVITVPKGSYTPVFTVGGDGTGQRPPLDEKSGWPAARRPSTTLWLSGAALCLTAATAWIVGEWRTRTDSEPPPRLLTVTSQPGAEEDPALSADGHFVAYSWHPGTVANADLWLKAVDGEHALRLTETPDINEKWPQWSPDGQYIAYTSIAKGRPPSIFKVSRLGGAPVLIAERAVHAIWTPDNKSMVVVSLEDSGTALVEHVLATGARRTLMQAPAGYQEGHPRVSPDGRRLAFTRSGSGRTAVFVMPMSGGDAKRLGKWNNGPIGAVSWTPDGRELLVSQRALSGRQLVRLDANEAGTAIEVRGVPREALGPSVSSVVSAGGGYRLAFVAGQPDLGLRLVDLHAPLEGDTITAVTPFCEATRLDVPGRFSPDGTLVAFTSDRGGNQQVWIARRDGSSIRSLTRLPDAAVNVGGWSPDGRWVAFDAAIGDKTAIYRVSIDGTLEQLTDDSATNTDPEWSRDGAWIYYASTASGREEIWKIPAGGGKAVQLTSEGGSEPRASLDARHVYFVDRPRMPAQLPATLKRVSTEGGSSSVVYAGISPGSWDVTVDGVVFVMRGTGQDAASRDRDVLAMLDTTTGRVRHLGKLPFPVSPYGVTRFLVASRDGRWVAASHIDRWDRDIIVLDNFR